jgi:hypothetical protein
MRLDQTTMTIIGMLITTTANNLEVMLMAMTSVIDSICRGIDNHNGHVACRILLQNAIKADVG